MKQLLTIAHRDGFGWDNNFNSNIEAINITKLEFLIIFESYTLQMDTREVFVRA